MARNALLSAGHELGEDGPHWPVIKSALASLARSYEALKIEEEVTERLRTHMQEALSNYEMLLDYFKDDVEPAVMKELQAFVAELRDIYNARFETIEFEGEPGIMDGFANLARDIDGMMPASDAALILNRRDTAQ
jgi:hypothetical protein